MYRKLFRKPRKGEHKKMIKSLSNIISQDKEKFVIPKTVQNVIPIKALWEEPE